MLSKYCAADFSLWTGSGAGGWDVEGCDWEDEVRRWVVPARREREGAIVPVM